MHTLEFEKIMDKLGSKYEAVVRMAITANQLADGDFQNEQPSTEKVTTTALKHYIQQRQQADAGVAEKA